MGAVLFYRITRSSVDATVRNLATRALSQGWRVAVRGRSTERLDRLDNDLWLGPDEDFLPHGMAGGPYDADQLVLLTTAAAHTNAAVALMALEGADFAPADVTGMERVWVIFDGNDPYQLEVARNQWRMAVSAGLSAQFWAEEDGSWKKKEESGPAT
ncbi:MAG: DNA polymerase III subunit chi [Cereibacter sphaeroides]|uniref:DNA polymerase III subunit chi n=1 Tax=Cereibacter sphaeroides TaxID=1063 RepID=A0A2W5S9F0_CERSP|nr:MAG: DNA polymerase III subunit chi [Cereibacter sphaeroides]